MMFWHVDAFTDVPYSGNPAAVFVHYEAIDDGRMQEIAIEMNLSESAFVLIRPGENPFLRWFTPMCEIDLCGHATLATAHVLFKEMGLEQDEVTFDTKFVGPLSVKKNGGGYLMDFPSRPGKKLALEDIPSYVFDALSEKMPSAAYLSRDLMLVYDEEDTVLQMDPDFFSLRNYENFIIVTAKSEGKYDFISRFFCAADGILEDPVTGSAHCTLAPYWANRLGKNQLKAFQASKRGGELFLDYLGDRVTISGEAVTIYEGSYNEDFITKGH